MTDAEIEEEMNKVVEMTKEQNDKHQSDLFEKEQFSNVVKSFYFVNEPYAETHRVFQLLP